MFFRPFLYFAKKGKNISDLLHIQLNSGGFARKSLSTTSKSNMLAEGGVSTLATASSQQDALGCSPMEQ